MSPRPRKRANKPLPDNLYPNNGGKSYRYRNPQTGEYTGMGTDRAAAIAAAKELNSILTPQKDLVQAVLKNVTVAKHVEWFFENIAPEREYRPKTLEMYRTQTKKLVNSVGSVAIGDVTVKELAGIMEPMSARTSNQFRQVAVDIFKTAGSRGLCQSNPAEFTLKRRAKRARMRLTLEAYKAIHARCKPWMQNAMDLALVSLQRREDVARFRFDGVQDSTLYVIQEKTQKYDTGYLAIAIGKQLDAIIRRCRDDLASPYMVHRKPERKIKDRKGMDHWTQVKPEMLTRAFAEARDETGLFDDVPPEKKPTFHEIRGLGTKLYRDQGKDPQKLLGHATLRMTNNYDSDHEEIRWVEATADLKI